MPKFPLLLLDANVIIFAHELSIWSQLTEKCTITITRTVVDDEAYYWRDKQGIPHTIDLNRYIEEEKINCIDVPLAQVDSFRQKFGPTYLDRLDPGEADSLAFLYYSQEKWLICSADGIVFKALGCLRLGEQGISLEKILQQIGLTRELDEQHKHYTEAYRLKLTKMGQQEGITGMAFQL